ncbi:MAG: hypothetical protein AB1632_08330 [Nitrospirota bacterium]
MEESKILIGLDFSMASKEVIEVLIEDASEPGIFDEIAKANVKRPEILKILMDHPDIPEDVRKFISDIIHLPVRPAGELTRAERTHEMRAQSMIQKIQKLSVSERIHLALRGGREIRGILIKDPNKEVMLSVLENQKITESEIEMIARSRSVPEEALRRISKNRDWLKNYLIVLALVTNPKTPSGIAVTLVSSLKTRDLTILEKNKNVAEVVRSAAKKLLQWRKPK